MMNSIESLKSKLETQLRFCEIAWGLKCFGIRLDDKLSWKPQVKVGNTTLRTLRNVVQIKNCTNISVFKYVPFAIFHSHLTYSLLNWEEPIELLHSL